MRLTVLGSCGAWPAAGDACSGFLVEHDGFRLVLDLGYAVVPRLLTLLGADEVDAVVISHGHPDHCADLNPLLRARTLVEHPAPPLPVYAPAGALNAVLALDRPGMLDAAVEVHELPPTVHLGPFRIDATPLPHTLPNMGVRVAASGRVLAYTGDTGPSPSIVELARGADVLLAEATYVDEVPEDSRRHLSSARQAGEYAAQAGVGRLLMTHLWPGADPAAACAAAEGAAAHGAGSVRVASAGEVVDLD